MKLYEIRSSLTGARDGFVMEFEDQVIVKTDIMLGIYRNINDAENVITANGNTMNYRLEFDYEN